MRDLELLLKMQIPALKRNDTNEFTKQRIPDLENELMTAGAGWGVVAVVELRVGGRMVGRND